MKKLLFALALIAFCSPAWAAGTLTATTSDVGGGTTKYSVAWVSDASGNVTTNTFAVKKGHLVEAKFIPNGGGTQPSDLYDMTIADADGLDVLNGTGANLSQSTVTFVAATAPLLLEGGNLTPSISNAGNAKGGTFILFVGP